MFLLCLFSILNFRSDDPMNPGYWTYIYSDSTISFDLNYSYDAVFLLDDPNSYIINVKFLDMVEYQSITPQGFGFAGQFLTNVAFISTNNDTHSIQIYILPKEYCSHNYITYYSMTSQRFRTSWDTLSKDHFQVCYLYQSIANDAKLTAKLNADTLSNAAYAYPEDYKGGTFHGHDIPHSENVGFDLKNGLIVRLQGKSHPSSEFDLTVKPFDSSKNESHLVSSLPFYYVVTPYGYNFLDDIKIHFEIKSNKLVNLSPKEIGGIAMAGMIFLVVILVTLWFLFKRLAWRFYRKQKRI